MNVSTVAVSPQTNEETSLVKFYKLMIWITLYSATLHFVDNVYFFDDYPEPAWLSAPIVGLLWLPVALMAHRSIDYVYRGKIDRSFTLIHGFVFCNWLSLGHYLFASPTEVTERINLIIALQVACAAVLFVFTLYIQFARYRESLPYTKKTWIKIGILYAIIIPVLELFWPSKFVFWWL